MSRIKEFYHEEICKGLGKYDHSDEEYFIEKAKREVTCDGYKTSNCCGASFAPINRDGQTSDICCDCGEHAAPSCVDCEFPCGNYTEEVV